MRYDHDADIFVQDGSIGSHTYFCEEEQLLFKITFASILLKNKNSNTITTLYHTYGDDFKYVVEADSENLRFRLMNAN